MKKFINDIKKFWNYSSYNVKAELKALGFTELYEGKSWNIEKGKGYFVISPQDNFEELFSRKADKKRKLYNGMLKCDVYMFFK